MGCEGQKTPQNDSEVMGADNQKGGAEVGQTWKAIFRVEVRSSDSDLRRTSELGSRQLEILSGSLYMEVWHSGKRNLV